MAQASLSTGSRPHLLRSAATRGTSHCDTLRVHPCTLGACSRQATVSGGSTPYPRLVQQILVDGAASCWKNRALLVKIVRCIRIPNSKRGYGYLPSETLKNMEEVRPVNPVERLAWAMFFTEPTGTCLRRVSEGRYPCRRARMVQVL